MSSVGEIYDQLFLFESGRDHPFPVHKKLIPPKKELLKLITETIEIRQSDHLFDAGCGNGHSLFWLNEKFGCTGQGVSLSSHEISFARKFAEKINKSDQLKFSLRSYDEIDTLGPFDKIFAIESLKHSTSLKISLLNLIEKLDDNGLLVVCDDFKIKEGHSLKLQSKLWESPGFTTYSHFQELLSTSNKILKIEKLDLSNKLLTRSKTLLYGLITLVNIILPFFINKRNIRTYLGGLLLELEYAKGNAEYLMICIQKKSN